MKVGIIGAGKVGCSLGRYFIHQGIQVVGFYSRTQASAIEAAQVTHTEVISRIDNLLTKCDVLFLTVTDDQIASVWNQIKEFPIQGKLICHCSGSLSSTIFSGIENTGAYGYSIHPMFPFQSKTTSYEELSQAVISVEGSNERLQDIQGLLSCLPNSIVCIKPEEKVRYHAGAVFASNLVVGLIEQSLELLESCGFTRKEALKAITPLAKKNLSNVLEVGPKDALTGPIERGDVMTVKKHLKNLSKEEKASYIALSSVLIKLMKGKHVKADNQLLQRSLEEENEEHSEYVSSNEGS